MKKRFSKSVKKYFRLEKARIRRDVSDISQQNESIKKIYDKFTSTKIKKI